MENNKDYIDEAQKTAEIVLSGIKNENYSDMNRELAKITINQDTKEEFVFGYNEKGSSIAKIIICGMLALGFIYFLIMGFAIISYSEKYKLYGGIAFCLSIIFIIFNFVQIIKETLNIKFMKRYNLYYNNLKYKSIHIIADVSEFTKISESLVIKDLRRAIKLKLIPQGHFGCDNLIFIVSDDVFDMYKLKQAVYDRYYRKIVEGRERMSERTRQMQKIMELGEQYVKKIQESNEIIKDKNITKKLDRMEKTVATIFHEVDICPKKTKELGLFMNYYLPTTEKLLEAYISIDEKPIRGKSLMKAKKDIEHSMDMINDTFEGILDKFYQEQEMDIASDIAALEIMMKQNK